VVPFYNSVHSAEVLAHDICSETGFQGRGGGSEALGCNAGPFAFSLEGFQPLARRLPISCSTLGSVMGELGEHRHQIGRLTQLGIEKQGMPLNALRFLTS